MYKINSKYFIFCLIPLLVLGSVLSANINVKMPDSKLYEMEHLIVLKVKPCNYNNEYTFTDNRDKKKYRQIQIGNQCWMAENLNYGEIVPDMEQHNNNKGEKSFYENDTSIGKKLGGLYSWEEAVGYKGSMNNSIVRGLCPEGWHIPSDKEWSLLTSYLDPTCSSSKIGWTGTNIALLLIEDAGLNIRNAGNAVSGWFFYLDKMAYFWTSSGYSSSSAWYRSFSKDVRQIYRGPGDIKIGMSVRCIKDQ